MSWTTGKRQRAIRAFAVKTGFADGLDEWERWFDKIGTKPSLVRYARSACAAARDYLRNKMVLSYKSEQLALEEADALTAKIHHLAGNDKKHHTFHPSIEEIQ